MDSKKFVDILGETGALKKGHFKLSSGLHSDTYIQCALMLQYPEHADFFGKEIAKKVEKIEIDTVISPAVGGLIIGQEVARALKVKAIFAERVEGNFTLRRGFSINPGEKILVVEDVFTTGKSSLEVGNMIESIYKGKVVGYAAICDRRSKVIDEKKFKGKPFYKLQNFFDVSTYNPAECPLCLKKIPLSIPGSRYNNIKAG